MKKLFVNELLKSDKKVSIITINSLDSILSEFLLKEAFKNKKIINLISESFNNFNKETLMKEIKNILEE